MGAWGSWTAGETISASFQSGEEGIGISLVTGVAFTPDVEEQATSKTPGEVISYTITEKDQRDPQRALEIRVNPFPYRTAYLTVSCTAADSEPPVVSVPADLSVEATGIDGAVVNFDASSSDGVDGELTAACVPSSGETFPLGTTTVECTATDQAGNTGEASFTVTVGPPAGSAGLVVLIAGVEALELPTADERNLLAPLSQSVKLLSDNNTNNDSAVCGKLTSFQDHVQDGVEEGSLGTEQAGALTAFAQARTMQIGCHKG